jgi:hypothetical protein
VQFYNNAEIRQSGRVIRANVGVEVDSFVPVTGELAGVRVWSGVLRPPNNIGLVPGETYTLVIPGFLPTKIEITSEASAHDGSVPFRGVGSLPVGTSQQT